MKGHLFHIQRFSLDDGTGIRTVVFLKGCNQTCIWCHNPESLKQEPQLMRVDSLCTRCGRCRELCPKGAVGFRDGAYHTDRSLCIDCKRCAEQCPQSAIRTEGYEEEAKEVFKTILKDRLYYEESGGGVTFSGGEPTVQGEFLLELLGFCKEAGISTAIETNGNTPQELVKRLSPLLDEVMVDLKHTDEAKHRKFTGAGNKRTLEAIPYYLRHNRTEVRIPVIPGFNDTAEELGQMMDFLAKAQASEVVLLPYHTFGTGKYKNLDIPYKMAGIKKLSGELLEEILRKVEVPSCLKVKIDVK